MSGISRQVILDIKRKAMTFDTAHRMDFATSVVDPPVADRNAAPLLRSRIETCDAYWDGYSGMPDRKLSIEFARARQAGKLRRTLEDAGKLPRIGALEVDPVSGLPIETGLPPDTHFGDEGYVRSVIGTDGACYVLYDRDNGGDWIEGDSRWTVARFLTDGRNTGTVSFPTRRFADSVLADEKAGRFTGIDLGQEDGAPAP